MAARLFIGVDGGATKTHMAIADSDGKLLGVHESGGTYYVLDGALSEMVKLLEPIKGLTISVAVFAVAGWDFKTDQQKQQTLIEEALAINKITVENAVFENDIFSTFKSAKNVTGPVIVLSCGTGIIGMAAENGRYYRTPGYEYLSGEWGSGIHQAEYAIHLACASLLGRIDHYPILNAKALNYFGAADVDTLAYNISTKFASNKQRGYFLKQVYDAYREGCPGAKKVVDRAGNELARTAWCLLKKVQSGDVTIIFGGGVITQFGLPPTFAEQLYQLTGRQYEIHLIKNPPVYGALKWALELANIETKHVDELLS